MGLVVRSVASQVKIAPSDTAAFDAFGRIRMSAPETIFDSKLIVDNAPLFWDDTQVSGTAASAHNTNQASVTLSVSSAIGRRIRQTKRRFAYQPGKSILLKLRARLAGYL